MPVKARPAEERFWSHVEKTDGCWLWKGNKNRGFTIEENGEQRNYIVQHYAYEAIYGVKLEKGTHVACKYGNRFCTRPDHLYVGSPPEDIKKNLPETIENFWNRVEKTKECWIWTGNINKSNGYGRFYYLNRGKGSHGYGYAHRFSYELHYGPIPKGMYVCHHCDNPPCTRPDHLFLGTIQENFDDMRRKDRHRRKLDSTDVIKIREEAKNGMSYDELAEKYHMGKVAMFRIATRRTWTWVA
jgi:hypothetical protein